MRVGGRVQLAVWALMSFCVGPCPAWADHTGPIAPGTPPVGCGAAKLGITITGIKKYYGEPAKVRRETEDKYPDRGTAEYQWNVGGLQIVAATHFVGAHESTVYSVEIEGKAASAHGTCVVRLGSSLKEVIRAYGKAARITARFPGGRPSSFGMTWRDGTSLKGTADAAGRVFYLHLLAPVE